jgi:hypothetical protein
MQELQNKLDIQKWIDSQRENRDLCGSYDFCSKCNKSLENPCAIAYTLFNTIEEEIEEIDEELEIEDDEEDDEEFAEISKEKYIQLTFLEKLGLASDKTKERYGLLCHSLAEKGIALRISKKHVLVKKNRKSIGKITLTKNALKIHLAVDPKSHEEISHLDYSHKKAYEEMPFTIRVTTKKSIKNAVSLV